MIMKKRLLFNSLAGMTLFLLLPLYATGQSALTVPYLTSELTIDGIIDDWPLEIEYVPLNNYINKVEGWIVEGEEFSSTPFSQSDLSAQMLVAHDLKFFYLFVEVMDDVDGVQDDLNWKSDNVEFFFNPDLGNDIPYDGESSNYTGSDGITDAIQHRIARDTTISKGLNLSPNWVTENWNYEFVVNNQTASYTIEVKVPLDSIFTDHTNVGDWVPDGTSLGLPIKEGTQFGFEVMVTDYDKTDETDDDQNRDGHVCWANNSGNDLAYRNTGLFGTVTLGAQTNNIQNTQNNYSYAYPNPCVNNILLKNAGKLSKIEIYNVLGKKVMSKDSPTSHVNVSTLNQGIYFLNITTNSGNIHTLKIIKK